MLFLARAGFDVSETMETIDDALRLAQAGALDLGSAADIATNVLTGFRLETDQATRVVDVLALAANSANTDVMQLGQAMKFVAPVAAGVGVELETAAAAIGALSDAGLQATMAGTGLRRVLGTLEQPTSSEAEVLKRLGIELSEVEVSSVGLVAALKRLQKSGIDTGTALELFGDRGGPAFSVLVNSIPKIEAMDTKLQGAAGTAERIAAIMDDNLNGALLAVKSAFEAVILAMGELGAESVLTGFMRGLASLLRTVANNIEIVTKVGTILGAALASGVIYRGFMSAVAWLGKFNIGATIAANRMVLLRGGLFAAVTALVMFSDQLSVAGDGFITLEDYGKAAMEGINEAIDEMVDVFVYGMNESQKAGDTASNNISLAFIALLRAIAQILDKVGGIIVGTLGAIGFSVQAALEGRWKDIGATFSGAFMEGFNQSVLTDFIDDTFDRAETKAIERAKRIHDENKAAAEAAGGATVPTEPVVEPPAVVTGRDFAQVLSDLDKEYKLLKMTNAEREIQAEIMQIEKELERQLTDGEKELLAVKIGTLNALARQNDLLNEIVGPQEDLAQRVKDLKILYDEGRISLEQYNLEMEKARQTSLSFATDAASGVSRGFQRIKDDIRDVSAVAEDTLVSAFGGAEDALVSFVTKGSADFKGLIDSILGDLTRLLLRQALLALIPGFGPALSAAPLPGFQTGGSFKVGGSGGPDSQLVAFKGTPGEKVNVQTPGQQQKTEAPKVNVPIKVVNQMDPRATIDAIDTPAGERVILNVIQRNPSAVRRLLGG
jgi:TP901 family phage tail tape measure protein